MFATKTAQKKAVIGREKIQEFLTRAKVINSDLKIGCAEPGKLRAVPYENFNRSTKTFSHNCHFLHGNA